eukprot:271827-Hanusia_phi.AAC.1
MYGDRVIIGSDHRRGRAGFRLAAPARPAPLPRGPRDAAPHGPGRRREWRADSAPATPRVSDSEH